MARIIYVGHFCFALGEHSESVEEAAEHRRTLSNPTALREAGFARHHFCGPGTSAYELARRMLEPHRAALKDIGAIVYATSLPLNGNVGDEAKYRESRDVKHLMDFPASHLQADFGLEGAMVVGVNQLACTSLLGAMRLAKMMLLAEPELKNVLCVTADRFPDGAVYEQAYNLISDGAAACIVSTEPSAFRFVGGHAITNGAMAFASDDQTVGSYFTYTYRLIHEALAKAKLGLGDIHWIVSQNINLVTWRVLASLLKFDRERVLFPTMPDVGHMISGDNVANMKVLLDEGKPASGERVLLPMAGYGLNWQCVILEKE